MSVEGGRIKGERFEAEERASSCRSHGPCEIEEGVGTGKLIPKSSILV